MTNLSVILPTGTFRQWLLTNQLPPFLSGPEAMAPNKDAEHCLSDAIGDRVTNLHYGIPLKQDSGTLVPFWQPSPQCLA